MKHYSDNGSYELIWHPPWQFSSGPPGSSVTIRSPYTLPSQPKTPSSPKDPGRDNEKPGQTHGTGRETNGTDNT